MRRENLVLWIAAFSTAAAGWLLTQAAWCCEVDPWGLASAVIPESVGPATAAVVLQHGCQACGFAALMLLSAGLIEEAKQESPKVRKATAETES